MPSVGIENHKLLCICMDLFIQMEIDYGTLPAAISATLRGLSVCSWY